MKGYGTGFLVRSGCVSTLQIFKKSDVTFNAIYQGIFGLLTVKRLAKKIYVEMLEFQTFRLENILKLYYNKLL